MIPYLILVFVPFIFYYVSIAKKKGKLTLNVGDTQEVVSKNCILPVFFIIFALILILRDETIGRDIANYEHYFVRISKTNFKDLFNSDMDILYVFLNWLVGRFTDNFHIFLAIVSLITVVPIAVVYSQDREFGPLKTILFINMPTFIMAFSGLRQALAITMGVIAYEFVKKKKLFYFLLFSFIAWGFHHTAFMLFLLYPLYHNPFKKKHLLFVVSSFILVFVFNRQIFTVATRIVSTLFNDEDYLMAVDDNGAYTMVILFVIFAVFSYVIPDEDKMDREALGLRNILLISGVLQCFAPIHMLAMRMNYYFIIFVPIAIAKILKFAKSNLKDVAWISKIVLIIFFMVYYLLNTYRSCQTGISALDIYPYLPFWK